MEPVFHVFERLLIGHIENDGDPMRTSVVGRGDGAKALLTGRVPYLELDRLALQVDRLDLEINANSGN